MTTNTSQPQNTARPAPASASASAPSNTPAPAVKPSGNMTFTVQKGAGPFPSLKK
jgi:hypothetical protein